MNLETTINGLDDDYNMAQRSSEVKCQSTNGLDNGCTVVPRTFVLCCVDKQKLEIAENVAKFSKLIQIMAEGDPDEVNFMLPNVTFEVLLRVCEYMNHLKSCCPTEIEKPLQSSMMETMVSKWEADFIEVDQQVLFDLILAANYMDIPSLLNLACAKVASMIKGKTAEQIRTTFDITNDFTPEEEDAVRVENEWAEHSA
jgi:S-phase kinase-associated protein 1